MRCLLLITCVWILGCGSGGPFDYVKVQGKAGYEDGTPIPGTVRLRFAAEDAPPVGAAVPRPALANVNSRGEFTEVTSYKYGDGLIPGKHRVAIEATDQAGKSLVPKEFASTITTPLVIHTDDSPLDIKVPRVKPR